MNLEADELGPSYKPLPAELESCAGEGHYATLTFVEELSLAVVFRYPVRIVVMTPELDVPNDWSVKLGRFAVPFSFPPLQGLKHAEIQLLSSCGGMTNAVNAEFAFGPVVLDDLRRPYNFFDFKANAK